MQEMPTGSQLEPVYLHGKPEQHHALGLELEWALGLVLLGRNSVAQARLVAVEHLACSLGGRVHALAWAVVLPALQ